jgi:hypothetical protein
MNLQKAILRVTAKPACSVYLEITGLSCEFSQKHWFENMIINTSKRANLTGNHVIYANVEEYNSHAAGCLYGRRDRVATSSAMNGCLCT